MGDWKKARSRDATGWKRGYKGIDVADNNFTKTSDPDALDMMYGPDVRGARADGGQCVMSPENGDDRLSRRGYRGVDK